MNEEERFVDLLKALTCFGCNYADGCYMKWTKGNCYCEEMLDNARAFAEENNLRTIKNDTG